MKGGDFGTAPSKPPISGYTKFVKKQLKKCCNRKLWAYPILHSTHLKADHMRTQRHLFVTPSYAFKQFHIKTLFKYSADIPVGGQLKNIKEIFKEEDLLYPNCLDASSMGILDEVRKHFLFCSYDYICQTELHIFSPILSSLNLKHITYRS